MAEVSSAAQRALSKMAEDLAALELELGEAKRKADDWMNTYHIRFADYQKIKKQRDTYHLDRDRLELEKKEWIQQRDHIWKERKQAKQDRDLLQAKVERLRHNLEFYGEHDRQNCKYPEAHDCTCGLDEALADEALAAERKGEKSVGELLLDVIENPAERTKEDRDDE